MFYWIYDIPNWQLALLFVAAFVAYSTLGTLATRRLVRRWLADQPNANELVNYFMSSFGMFYGLLLGLIAVGTYQNYSDVDKTVTKEASALAALYRDITAYPTPIRTEMHASLREYCRYVIDEAWPAQRRGIIPEGGTLRMDVFQALLFSFQPETKAQELSHAQTLHQYNLLIDIRRQRLQCVTTGLPPSLWQVVAVGAVLNIAITWLLKVQRLSVHLVLSGTLAAFIGLMIFLIAAMDNPLRGDVSVSAEAFETVQRSLMRPTP